MLSEGIAVIEVLVATALLATYAFPMGVLFKLFRMDDRNIRRMEHYLDFPSVFFGGETAVKDYLAVLGVNLFASAVLSLLQWTPVFLLSAAVLALAMFGPMQAYANLSRRRHDVGL